MAARRTDGAAAARCRAHCRRCALSSCFLERRARPKNRAVLAALRLPKVPHVSAEGADCRRPPRRSWMKARRCRTRGQELDRRARRGGAGAALRLPACASRRRSASSAATRRCRRRATHPREGQGRQEPYRPGAAEVTQARSKDYVEICPCRCRRRGRCSVGAKWRGAVAAHPADC